MTYTRKGRGRGLKRDVFFCLQVDWPLMSGSYKWGEGERGLAPCRTTLLIFNTITSVLSTFGPIPLVVFTKQTL